MKRLKNLALVIISLSAAFQQLQAQDNTVDTVIRPSATVVNPDPFTGAAGFKTWSIGVNVGGLAPVVPIGGSNDFTKWNATFGYGLYIKKQIGHRFSLQADFLIGTLKGDNSKTLGNGQNPNRAFYSFNTDLNWSAGLSGAVYLGNINWINRFNTIVPYVSTGAGIVNYTPTVNTSTSGNGQQVAKNVNELYIPVTAGLKVRLSDNINLDLGYRMNFVDGDNLDGYHYGPQKDKFSYGFAGIEIALGKRSKPQLLMNNPAYNMQQAAQRENDALRARVSSSLAETDRKNAEMQERINQLQNKIEDLTKDSDGDGVPDSRDKCPNTPAGTKVDGSGCPLETKPAVVVVTEEDRKVVNEAIKNLEFDFGKATIRSKSFPSLDRVAELLVSKNFSLKLAGHTDNVGSDAANLKLSKDRAESVKSYLVSKGANASRIEATGYGKTQPIATNKTAAGRQKNRRVEFTLF